MKSGLDAVLTAALICVADHPRLGLLTHPERRLGSLGACRGLRSPPPPALKMTILRFHPAGAVVDSRGFFTCAEHVPLPPSADGTYTYETKASAEVRRQPYEGSYVYVEYRTDCEGDCRPPSAPPARRRPRRRRRSPPRHPAATRRLHRCCRPHHRRLPPATYTVATAAIFATPVLPDGLGQGHRLRWRRRVHHQHDGQRPQGARQV